MGQSAIIILAGAFLVGSLLLFGMRGDTRDADERLHEHQNKLLARDAAVTGLNLAVRQLADDDAMGSWTSSSSYNIGTTSYDGNSFSVEAFPGDPSGGTSGDTITLVARGAAGPGRKVIYARYARDEDDKGIPPAFKNAIASDFYFQLQGNVGIFAIEDSLNASIHTNDDLTINGNSFLIEGFGTYTGSVNISNAAADNFLPNIDYNGADPNHFQTDSVAIPSIDIDKLRTTAAESGVIITTGGLPLQIDGDATGPIDFTDPTNPFWTTYGHNCTSGSCGTPESPFVMVVEGELNLLNTVQVIGYGTIVATGNIEINPTGAGGGVYGGLNTKNETKVLLATLGDIDVSGNACFGLGPSITYGNDGTTFNNNCDEDPVSGSTLTDHTNGISLYAEGLVDFGGTPYIVGGVVAREASFGGGGNPMITYASGAEETLDSGFENIIPIGPILIAYSEW